MHEYQHLIDRVERRKEERKRISWRESEYKDHIKAIKEASGVANMSFWCNTCKRDYDTLGVRRVGQAGLWPVAWYVGKCGCGSENIRRVTDKSKDLYYFRSKMIRFQRASMALDLLNPDDPLFPVIYSKQWRDMQQNKHG